mgnify:CR=1 FL=1
MPAPEGAELLEESGADGDVAFVASFGVSLCDADGEGLAIDVGGANVERFVESQAALVNGGEECPVSTVAKGAQ